ncbi:hypothetical protein J5Y09_19110 [Roseomonas sp. PWR1]|uniref:DUF4329 domain-containing protein n=1 Tax=Roseomonas nitratireducens TaxID=2820810 RepID=A0ABS4AXF2_9PROT|nr:hypothetical protein [Neoroseomonas nitratireducens]MBP0466044.1 hypothetical protein [Neoroseomonas nitratireducens]
MAGAGAGQRKDPTKEGGAIETLVKARLAKLLPLSRGDQLERGGIVHRHNTTQVLGFVECPPGTEEDLDIGFKKDGCGRYLKPNRGCPPGTTPVAFYHTHGRDDSKRPAGMRRAGPAGFSDEDMRIATEEQLVAFVALDDGRWLRYAPVQVPVAAGSMECTIAGVTETVPFRAQHAFDADGQPFWTKAKPEPMNGNLLR